MNKKIKVSFIGAGNMANEHIKVFYNNKNFLTKGIFSRSKKKVLKIQSKYKNLKSYQSIEALFKKTESDLLVICINEEQYKKIILKVIKFPWVILAEKPLGLNFKEINYTYNVAKKNKSKIFISLNRRFYKSTINAKKIVKKFKEKRIIKVVDCQNRKVYFNNAQKNGIKKSLKSIKYLMYTNSVHLLDYITQFCRGELIKIKNNKSWNIKSPKNFISRMTFSSGDQAIYFAFWEEFKRWQIKISFNKHKIKIKPLEKLINNINFPLIKKIDYSNDVNFKPGLLEQSKEIEKFFSKKKHKLVQLDEYMRTVFLIKKIYKV